MIDADEKYICLINEEEQYSLWYAWKDIPIGWKRVGPEGTRDQCLAYINEVWTDMRPKSLKDKMEKSKA